MTIKEYNLFMKILIYDNNIADLTKFCELLESLPIELFIDKVTHYDDGLKLYNKYQYDFVFIDFKDENGEKLLNEILGINQTQQIITISDTDICSEEKGCDFCITKYNKKRITKPINGKDLIDIFVKKSPCPLYCDDKLLLQLSKLSKTLPSVKFDKETYRFFKNKEMTDYRTTQDMITLTYTLNEKKIPYVLLEDGIQIIKDQAI